MAHAQRDLGSIPGKAKSEDKRTKNNQEQARNGKEGDQDPVM